MEREMRGFRKRLEIAPQHITATRAEVRLISAGSSRSDPLVKRRS
jgi:hypothetical protein